MGSKKIRKQYILLLTFLLFLSNCTSREKITPTQTGKIQITPTDEPTFIDNSIMRNIFKEHPYSECETTDLGWECYRDVTESGRWYLNYMKTKFDEVYESLYIDFDGLSREVIADVLSGTEAIIQNDNMQNAVHEWMMEEGLEQATYNKSKTIIYEAEGIHVFLYFNDIVMSFSLCYGDGCD